MRLPTVCHKQTSFQTPFSREVIRGRLFPRGSKGLTTAAITGAGSNRGQALKFDAF